MIRQHRILYNAGILAFALLMSSGCTSKNNADAGDIGNSDKYDVSYDVHEVSDIDESSDASTNPKDTDLIEDVKDDSDSDDDVNDSDAANDEDVDEEYEAKLQVLNEYYSTRNSSEQLVQYQQWLILKTSFNPLAPPPYWTEFVIYNKDVPHKMAAFSGHPEHHYISNIFTRPSVFEHYLFIIGPGTLVAEDNTTIPSIRVYDLDMLPQAKVSQEIYLNQFANGSESTEIHCGFDQIMNDMNFFVIKDAVIVICNRQMIRHTLVKDANDLFHLSGSKVVEGIGISSFPSATTYGHQTSDGNVYLIMESEDSRTRDVLSLSQDGILAKISNIQLPQYEARGELIQPTFAYKKPEWIGNHLWVPTDKGPFAAVFDMSDPAQPTFLHYTQKFGTLVRLHASGSYVFALISAATTPHCTEDLFDEHCVASKFDVMLYDKNSPSPISSLSNVIELDTDGDGFDNYSSIGDIVFDDPMLYLTQAHNYKLDTSTQRGILKIDLSERLSELPF